MRGIAHAGLLGLAACNLVPGGNEANQAGAGGQKADAAAVRPIPCSVEAHGMGAVLGDNPVAPCDSSVDPQTMALDALIRIIPDQHPSFYYVLASRLFAAERKEDAVFWLYAGQLRYRIRLACHPELAPDTEPALFGSLHETIGRPINEYAGGDPDAWAATMQRALDWDEATHNGFEPKAPCAAAIADQRGGLAMLIANVRETKDQIRRERAASGLPNR